MKGPTNIDLVTWIALFWVVCAGIGWVVDLVTRAWREK